jgi:hypothetical protein
MVFFIAYVEKVFQIHAVVSEGVNVPGVKVEAKQKHFAKHFASLRKFLFGSFSSVVCQRGLTT